MDNQLQIHRCGSCKREWDSEQGYLDHICVQTGFRPVDPEHAEALDPNYKARAAAALARGNSRVELEQQGMSPEEAIAQTRDIGKSVK